ncbi:MAG: NYN domain-containing protein [Candidatus Thermoplasmatota archaeon]
MTKARHRHQRIGIFVDVQNMYYSARNLYKSKVNFKKLLKEAINNRELIRAIAYVIKADVKDENSFYEALEDMGFEVKAKELQIFYGGEKKGDWDVGIAMDVMRLAPKLDTIVLVSGDGDFSDLLEHAKSIGCRTEVLAFGKTTSHKLLEVADFFVDLDKNKKYLLGKKR